MPQGLQVWDAAGVIRLDTSTRITRLHSFHSVEITLAQNLYQWDFAVPGLSQDGSWGIYVPNFYLTVEITAGNVRIKEPIRGVSTAQRLSGTYRLYVYRF